MKKIIALLIVMSFIGFSMQVNAQKGKDKAKIEQKEKTTLPNKDKETDKVKDNDNNKDKDKDKIKDNDNNKYKDKEKSNNGNHYGQNKGDLKGKEFGQHQAEQAHSKKDVIEKSDKDITVVDQQTIETKKKIGEAKEKLEMKRKNKEISEADYNIKKKAIEELEKDVEAVEKKSTEVKEKIAIEKKS